MAYERRMKEYLIRDKDSINYEEFKNTFYHKLKISYRNFEEGEFDNFLTLLYTKEIEDYSRCREELNPIPYNFVKKNQELVYNLVANDKTDLVKIAYEMEQKRAAVVYRNVEVVVCKSTVKDSKKELLQKLSDLLESTKIDNDDNVITKAKETYAEMYAQYADDEYLSAYYNSILKGIEEDILRKINELFNKTEVYNKRNTLSECSDIVSNDIRAYRKGARRTNVFKSTIK